MKILKLLPREDRFKTLLIDLAQRANDCALHLQVYSENDPAQKAQAASRIGISKSEAKNISADITQALCTSYITPYDREDIQDLADSLYKIPKMIEKVQERLDIYGPSIVGADFQPQMALIKQEAEVLSNMVNGLLQKADSRTTREQATRLYELENRGDQILNELLGVLYSADRPAREFVARKDMYDMLEKVIDRHRDVAAVVLRIILKYS